MAMVALCLCSHFGTYCCQDAGFQGLNGTCMTVSVVQRSGVLLKTGDLLHCLVVLWAGEAPLGGGCICAYHIHMYDVETIDDTIERLPGNERKKTLLLAVNCCWVW